MAPESLRSAARIERMTLTGKPRGEYAKTASRKREILEAGIDVFSTSGFRSGSIREIADKVGMSQAGLLHHFTNKNELLAGVLELRDNRSRAYIDFDAPLGVEALRGYLGLIEYNTSVRGLVELHCVLSAEATSHAHPAHDYFVERYRYVVESMTKVFRRIADAGMLAPGVVPENAARALIALTDGLQVQWLLDSSSLDMVDEARRYLQPLLLVEL